MLHLERSELALEPACLRTGVNSLLQLLHLALQCPFFWVFWRTQHLRKAQAGSVRRRLEPSFTEILLPLRKHELMNIQGVCNVLRLDLRMKRKPYRLNLELVAVAFDFLRTDRRCHLNSLER